MKVKRKRKIEPRSTFTFYACLSYITSMSFTRVNFTCVRTEKLRNSLNSVQQSNLTQYNNQKQKINQIETEDIELNNYMCIFPFSGEVRERDSSVYVLV